MAVVKLKLAIPITGTLQACSATPGVLFRHQIPGCSSIFRPSSLGNLSSSTPIQSHTNAVCNTYSGLWTLPEKRAHASEIGTSRQMPGYHPELASPFLHPHDSWARTIFQAAVSTVSSTFTCYCWVTDMWALRTYSLCEKFCTA
jgi:hypothetical protein